MEAIKTDPHDFEETHCPACNALINTSSIGRRRRVQCPKCREVVELGAKKAASAKKPAQPLLPGVEIHVPLAEIQALEARIAALEEAFVNSAPALPIEITIQRPEKKWKWIAPSEAHESDKLATNVADVLLHNLGNFDGHAIVIRANAGSARALARAASLKQVFDRADWTVEGPVAVATRGNDAGLFLAVGGLPLPPAAAAAYFAMTASGFTVQSYLDPKLAGNDTILIVA